MTDKPNRNARALAKMGASKGGKARASVLTPEQRKEIAKKAIRTRWAKAKGLSLEEGQVSSSLDQVVEPPPVIGKVAIQKPISLFQGELQIGDVSFSCHVEVHSKGVEIVSGSEYSFC